MRGRILRFLLVAAALRSGAAGAADVSGWIGGQGTRYDSWTPSGESLRLNLDAGLVASGYLFAPGEIDWAGNAAYGRNRMDFGGGNRTDENILTFGAHGSLFEDRRSAFRLRLDGGRSQRDFSQSGTGLEARPGTSVGNSFSAETIVGGRGYPVLDVRGSFDESITTVFDQPDIRRTSKAIDATARHGTDEFSYQLGYRGLIEEGSLAPLDYMSHYLTVTGAARITQETGFGIYGQYYTRTPRNSSGLNPKYDDSQVTASLNSSLAGFKGSSQYGFSHFILQTPGLPETEHLGHSLTTFGERALSPEWTLTPSAAFNYSADRVGTAEASGAGQNVGTLVRWSRSPPGRSYFVSGSARVGLIEPSGGGTEAAGGAGAGAGYGRATASGQYGGSYQFDVSSNLSGVRGWSVSQAVTANHSASLGRDVSLVSNLVLGATRIESPLAGSGASRTGTFTSALRWGARSAGVSAYLADGVAATLGSPVRGDGLFVPAGFQTHSRGVTVYAVSPLNLRWTGQASLRYGWFKAPDFPEQHELIATVRTSYRIGEFSLIAEEQFRAIGTSSLESRYNSFMIILARYFHL